MLRPFRCLVVVLSVVALHAGAVAAGESHERSYTIYRDGTEIGVRHLRIARDGDSLEVVNETRIAVKVAFITVFRRTEELREVWRDGRLVRFSSRVDDDGEHFEVTAMRMGEGALRVEGAAGTYEAPRSTLPATYWHEDIAATDTLIHVMRGSLQRVATTAQGEETLSVESGTVETRRYRMTGDERVDLWFDDSGLTVRVVYHEDDDTEIDFRATAITEPSAGLELPSD